MTYAKNKSPGQYQGFIQGNKNELSDTAYGGANICPTFHSDKSLLISFNDSKIPYSNASS